MVARLLLIYSLGVSYVIYSFVVCDLVILDRHLPRCCLKRSANSRSTLHLVRNHISYVIRKMVHVLHNFLLMSRRLFRRIDAILRETLNRLTVVIWDLGRLQIIVNGLTKLMLAYYLMANRCIPSVETLVAIFTIERSKSLVIYNLKILPLFQMSSEMIFHISFGCKSLLAYIACKGLFLCMYS